mgnify:CR=1 FL=1
MLLDKKSLKISQDYRKKNLPLIRPPRLKSEVNRKRVKGRKK